MLSVCLSISYPQYSLNPLANSNPVEGILQQNNSDELHDEPKEGR